MHQEVKLFRPRYVHNNFQNPFLHPVLADLPSLVTSISLYISSPTEVIVFFTTSTRPAPLLSGTVKDKNTALKLKSSSMNQAFTYLLPRIVLLELPST